VLVGVAEIVLVLLVDDGLRGLGAPRSAGRRGIMDVEVDPVEWPS